MAGHSVGIEKALEKTKPIIAMKIKHYGHIFVWLLIMVAAVSAHAMPNNLFVKAAGNYFGLFYPANGVDVHSSGDIQAYVTRDGIFIGRLLIDGESQFIFGQFPESGQATEEIRLPAKQVMTLVLRLDLNSDSANGPNSISGTISTSTWTNMLMAYRAATSAKSYAGSYTFAISGTPSSTSMPAGDGVGSVEISADGNANLSGELADGTPITSTGSVSVEGFLPIFIPMYSGKGACLGWLTFSNQIGSDVTGWIQWIKPGERTATYYPSGFTNMARLIGSSYHRSNSVPIIDLSTTTLTLAQGNLPSATSDQITLQKGNKITSTNQTLKVTVNGANGLFDGSVSNFSTLANVDKLIFHGAFLQKQNAGVGFFLGTSQSGLLTLGSNPFGSSPVVVTFGDNTLLTNVNVGPYGTNISFSAGSIGEITISFPAGALSSTANISLSENSGQFVPQSGTAPGFILNLQINGGSGSFNEPVSITIPYPTNGTVVPVPFYVSTDGTLLPCQVLSIDTNACTLTFQTFHASLYTWILAQLGISSPPVTTGATTYLPWVDGFQVGNPGSIYNPGGECFGICAWEQWYFKYKGGGFYPEFMQDIPLANGGTIKGQEVIRTRAYDSVADLWSLYIPIVDANYNLPPALRFASMLAVLDNTHIPTILNPFGNGSHAVLAYDHLNSNVLLINDPNIPGTTQTLVYNPSAPDILSYTNSDGQGFPQVALIGEGSFQAEGFDNIYADAVAGFDGNGDAQVNVTSDTDGETITARTVQLSGQISSGQVLVSELDIILNQGSPIVVPVDRSGNFSVELSLNAGTNTLGFLTKGFNGSDVLTNISNTQLSPFIINVDVNDAVILATLTWNTDNVDLDLYTIDPTGDYSCYFHKVTASGGTLDFDNTTGYGPEHWTLNNDDVIQWGGTYTFRVHYYDDHVDPLPGPAVPSQWAVTVVLYEGTANQQSFTYSGELDYQDASLNDEPNGSGASWADVCTVVPIQADENNVRPTVSHDSQGRTVITVPVPSAAERIMMKLGQH